MSRIYGGYQANDEAQDMICLKNAIAAETVSMTCPLLSVLEEIAISSDIIFFFFYASLVAAWPP